MKLDWMMLANYAEAPPNSGSIFIMGGGIDTVTAIEPLEGVPNAVAVVQFYLALRLLFHPTELGRERQLEVTILDEDGGQIGKIEGNFRPDKQPGVPAGWEQGFHLVFPLVGLPLPKFGHYTINLQIDRAHLGEQRFRILKGY